ncbi:hypothetical protein CMEL01_08135, partial [Colletotrichum melonis]
GHRPPRRPASGGPDPGHGRSREQVPSRFRQVPLPGTGCVNREERPSEIPGPYRTILRLWLPTQQVYSAPRLALKAFDLFPPPRAQCHCLPRPAPPPRPRDAASSAWKGHRPAAGQTTVPRPFGSRYNISHTNTCPREGAVLDNPANGPS